MARAKVELPPAEAIRLLADAAGRLALHVTPGSRCESIALGPDKLLIKVRTPPADGAANAAVLGVLARALDVPPSSLRLLRGATSREKLVQIPRP